MNIRFLREKLNIKQDAFEQIGIKKGTYSNYENGKTEPNIETLAKISKFLGIDLTALICTDLSMQDNLEIIKKDNSGEENAYLNAYQDAYLSPKSEENCNPSSEKLLPEERAIKEAPLRRQYSIGGYEPTPPAKEVAPSNHSNELIRDLIEQLNEKSEEIGALKQENSSLKHRLAQYAENAPDAQSARA